MPQKTSFELLKLKVCNDNPIQRSKKHINEIKTEENKSMN